MDFLKKVKAGIFMLLFIILATFDYFYIMLLTSDIPINLPISELAKELKYQFIIFIILFLIIISNKIKGKQLIFCAISLFPFILNIFLENYDSFDYTIEGYRNLAILDFCLGILSFVLISLIVLIYKIQK